MVSIPTSMLWYVIGVTEKGPKLKVGSMLATLDSTPVQKHSMSESCWFVARTHIGSGAASTA